MRFFKIPGFNSTQETVSYKKRENAVEEQDTEILISSSSEENQSSEKEGRSSPQLKICFYLASFFITLLIFFVALSTLNYSSKVLQTESHNGSCVPLRQVEKVIVETEKADFKSCSDNKTCHAFLDVIEREHNGLKYNFVIGQRGELYIGAGFKCLVHGDENALYVKLLKSNKLETVENSKMCRRLTEIIQHGIFCDKISLDYAIIQDEMCKHIDIWQAHGRNTSHNIHDPGHEMKLIHGDFGWTFCGPSTAKNTERDRVISLESLPEKFCSPLQLVSEITVDVVSTSPVDCFDVASCQHAFEEHHDGLNYNFIIGHEHDVYVGLGFNCTAKNVSDNVLKIKVLRSPKQHFNQFSSSVIEDHKKILQIIEEGIGCGRISEEFSVKANCNVVDDVEKIGCENYYELYNTMRQFHHWLDLVYSEEKYYNISSEHGRGVVPRFFRFHFCHNEHHPDTSTSAFDTTTEQPSNQHSTNIFIRPTLSDQDIDLSESHDYPIYGDDDYY